MFRGFSKRKSDHKIGPPDAPRRVSAGKSDLAITAPKRIVRAQYAYQAQEPDELSFNKNDFFYVTDESDPEWYVASNPLTNQSGLVPVSYFQVIQRQDPAQALSLTQAQTHMRTHSRNASVASAGTAGTAGSAGSGAAGSTAHTPHHTPANSQSSGHSHGSSRASLHLYGFVLYDFTAERNDELSVSAGESIVITAISNAEWFVAKPIGRLGGPGLIPVSYVEVREVGSDRPVENVLETVRRAGVPHVEEWKRRLAEYKASSIPLGRFGTAGDPLDGKGQQHHAHHAHHAQQHQYQHQHQHQHQYQQQYQQHQHARSRSGSGPAAQAHPQQRVQVQYTAKGEQIIVPSGQQPHQQQYAQQQQPYAQQQHAHANGAEQNGYSERSHSAYAASQSRETLPYVNESQDPYVVSASVDRFAINGGRYWYLVRAEMSNGRHRNLCRYYQDFYDFQIRLLEEFPVEAGRTGKPRSLPFMPGPLTLVTHTISTQRRANLDDYVRELIRMPPSVSRSRVMLNLFELRPGDVEGDGPVQQLPQPPEVGGLDDDLETAVQDTSENLPPHAQPASPEASPRQSLADLQISPRGAAAYDTSAQDAATPTRGSVDDSPAVLAAAAQQGDSSRVSSAGTMQPVSPHAARPYGERSASMSHQGDSQQSLKVKVYATDNVIAIRVPADLSFVEIYERIATRMAVSNPRLYATKDLTGEPVQTPSAFARAVNGSNKVALYLGP